MFVQFASSNSERMSQCSFLPVMMYVLVTAITYVNGGSVILNSNAIKSLATGPGAPTHGAGHAANSNPDEFSLLEGSSHNLLIDPVQSLTCSADEECGGHGFCFVTLGACLPCKRRRKRCTRDAMCCTGNQCSNGVCLPVEADIVQQFKVEEAGPTVTVRSSISETLNTHGDNSTTDMQSQAIDMQDLTLTTGGLEGEKCLRSSDCADGLCCARHFWSKICKPVLREGQVCTKHRKKGAPGLEIFQRCNCGEGLLCRTQDHRVNKAARSLHTCQHH